MNTPLLNVSDLRVRAGGRTLLELPALTLASGQVLGILGPNGAGKTTLLDACLGLRRFNSGRVELMCHSIGRLSSVALTRLRRHVGYVPQRINVPATMPLTVREVVAIGRTGLAGLLRPLRASDWHIIDEWIERLGLVELRDSTYARLSGGEQRKVVLARAMVQQPQLLVLDEPAAHLDLRWREQIVATLDELYADSRPAMLVVCHELEVLPSCCGEVLLLDRGQVLAQGAIESVLSAERVQALYGPGLRVLHSAGRHAVIPASIEEHR